MHIPDVLIKNHLLNVKKFIMPKKNEMEVNWHVIMFYAFASSICLGIIVVSIICCIRNRNVHKDLGIQNKKQIVYLPDLSYDYENISPIENNNSVYNDCTA